MGRKMGLSLANMAVGIALGLVAGKLASVYLGNANIGAVQFALSILGILFFITDLGMGAAHVKRVSEGRDPGDCFATFAVFKIVSTGIFVLAAFAMLGGYVFVLGRTIEDTSLTVILFVLVYYVAKSLQEIGQSSFDARLETAKSQAASLADTLVRTGLTILAALVVAALVHETGPLLGRIDPTGPLARWIGENPAAPLAVANALGGVAAATVALVLLRRSLERGRFRMDLLRDYATFALPLFVTTAIGLISFHIDGAVLGTFLHEEDLGLFTQAKRLPLVLAGVGVAVSTLLFPTLSAMAAQGDHAGISRSMDRSLRYLSMLMTPILVFTGVFAVDLIRILLSDEVVSGAFAMMVLCAYVFFTTIAIPHSNLLLGIGRPQVVARLGAAAALVLIALNLVLVPVNIQSIGLRLAGLGVNGAAIATLASGLVWYLGVRFATWRLAGYREHGHLWRHLAASALMAALLYGMDRWVLELARWFHVPLYTAVGGLAYLGGLVLLREFTAEDWRYFKTSLNPLEMFRYARGELKHRRR